MVLKKKPADAEARARDPERSRQAILKAARAAFAEHGLGGTRLDEIAEKAGVDKRLIYYYFNDKDALFLAVLEDAYQAQRDAERALQLDALEPVDAIKRLIEFSWRYYIDNPEYMTLLNSENLHKAKHLKQSKRLAEFGSPVISMLGSVLEKGRLQGLFRGGVDPIQLYVSLVGMTYIYLSNQHTQAAIFGRSLVTPRALNERLSHVTEVLLGYLLMH